jgi:hypothetical protein
MRRPVQQRPGYKWSRYSLPGQWLRNDAALYLLDVYYLPLEQQVCGSSHLTGKVSMGIL